MILLMTGAAYWREELLNYKWFASSVEMEIFQLIAILTMTACTLLLGPKVGEIFFCFILLTQEGSDREAYQEFQPSYDIFRRFGARGYSDHRFRAPLAYTAQLLNLHQHRANNQYRMANQI